MPVVKIDYDEKHFADNEMKKLCEAVRVMASESAGLDLEETVVYARKYQITAGTTPIEIFLEAGVKVMPDEETKLKISDLMVEKIKKYKAEHGLTMPFSFSIIKMDWKCSFDI
ncbi:MAG: hypothetical protein RLZZ283_171 [Candidatus Parcubacteria bacterium]|jgi:hypothetical protein